MKMTWRTRLGRVALWMAACCLPASADNAVNVTIEADSAALTVGESTTVRVYGRVDGAIEAVSEQITSWHIDVLNDNGAAAAGYVGVSAPASDAAPLPPFPGTPDGAHLRGAYGWFLSAPGAGKGSRIELLRFDVTALAAGVSTFSVVPGSTTGVDRDFQVAQLGFSGTFTGGNYAAASVEITVTGDLDLSGLQLRVAPVGTDARVTFNPLPGFDHVVESSTTLLPGSWTPLPGAPHNSGSVNQPMSGVPVRFYRVSVTPR